MSGRRRVAIALAAIVVLVASAAAFRAGRASVDRTPPALPAVQVTEGAMPSVDPPIVLPPKAVLP